MYKIFGFVFILCGMSLAYAADTCVRTTFNVTYTCNGGTLAGTLPADTIAEYGLRFTPTAITAAMCTPPDGYIYAGQAIIVDGQTVASYASTSSGSFTYYYTTDIEIGPHWVPVADPAVMMTNLLYGGRTYTRDATTMTWAAEFWYGGVAGIAKCSSVRPKNTADGIDTALIATDQDAIENDTTAGGYCYCKMSQPEIPGSPWVFYDDMASTCASNCAGFCGDNVTSGYDRGRRIRASVFAAAVRTAIEQAQQSGGNTAE